MSNILLITSSGGGGLLQSAVAIEQEEKRKNSKVKVIKRDVLMDWAVLGIGFFFKHFYNFTQIKGKVKIQSFLVRLNIYADYILSAFLFFGTFYNLRFHNIERVIDNQPISPSAVIFAIRIYNKIYKKNIILEKVFVDLPTKNYAQFLKSIKKLSKKNKSFLKIISAKPLLEENQTKKEFWKKYCDIPEDKVVYKYFLREAFKRYENFLKRKKDFIIPLKTSYLEETNLIKQCLEKSGGNFKETKEGFEFTISKDDKLIVILLGSQPASRATYDYVKNFIKFLKGKNRYYIFTFCKCFSNSKKSLFRRVCNLVEKENFSKNINIIPMSFQKEDVIAALFHRSDMTITRSGGHTIMELMKVARGKKFIHSEYRKKSDNFEKLLSGIPFWEAGNACYFNKKNDGRLISPKILNEYVI